MRQNQYLSVGPRYCQNNKETLASIISLESAKCRSFGSTQHRKKRARSLWLLARFSWRSVMEAALFLLVVDAVL